MPKIIERPETQGRMIRLSVQDVLSILTMARHRLQQTKQPDTEKLSDALAKQPIVLPEDIA